MTCLQSPRDTERCSSTSTQSNHPTTRAHTPGMLATIHTRDVDGRCHPLLQNTMCALRLCSTNQPCMRKRTHASTVTASPHHAAASRQRHHGPSMQGRRALESKGEPNVHSTWKKGENTTAQLLQHTSRSAQARVCCACLAVLTCLRSTPNCMPDSSPP